MRLPVFADETVAVGTRYVVSWNKKSNRAVCWAPHVDRDVLVAIYAEVDSLALARPITIYGHTSAMAETKTFKFVQVAAEVEGFINAPLASMCKVCGWRKSGIDSWDGNRCKCAVRRGLRAVR